MLRAPQRHTSRKHATNPVHVRRMIESRPHRSRGATILGAVVTALALPGLPLGRLRQTPCSLQRSSVCAMHRRLRLKCKSAVAKKRSKAECGITYTPYNASSDKGCCNNWFKQSLRTPAEQIANNAYDGVDAGGTATSAPLSPWSRRSRTRAPHRDLFPRFRRRNGGPVQVAGAAWRASSKTTPRPARRALAPLGRSTPSAPDARPPQEVAAAPGRNGHKPAARLMPAPSGSRADRRTPTARRRGRGGPLVQRRPTATHGGPRKCRPRLTRRNSPWGTRQGPRPHTPRRR